MRSRGGGRVLVVGLVLVAVLVAIGSLTVDRRTGRPFDPASAEPDGIKAMVELVSGFGADVSVPDHLPDGDDDIDVAVIFDDRSDAAGRQALRSWVAEGHVLVVADVASELAPMATWGGFGGTDTAIARGDCPITAFDDVGEIDPGDSTYWFDGSTLDTHCFETTDGAFLAARAEGAGTIVALASGDLLTNELLGRSDNAVLATALFAPRDGYRVALLTDRAFPTAGDGDGEVSLGTLIGPGVKLAFLELAVALVLLALASGRRLGRPVSEPQPVQIAGSELVEAVGRLLQHRRDPAAAAEVLRADLRRVIVHRFGIAPDAPAEVMVESIASRTRLERPYVQAVLVDQVVTSDDELAALATNIDRIREEVLHGHAP